MLTAAVTVNCEGASEGDNMREVVLSGLLTLDRWSKV